MDKEKQIEEMYNAFLNYRFTIPIDKFSYKGACEHFIKQGYRKINENEIVISKEEKQKLLKEMYKQGRFDAIADLEKDYKVVISKGTLERLFTEEEVAKLKEYARKETAREILERGKYCMPSGLREWIIEQYGVDLGEEK